MKIRIDEKEFPVSITPDKEGYAVISGGRTIRISKKNGKQHTGKHTVTAIRKNPSGGYNVTVDDESYAADLSDTEHGFKQRITAPMNGTVLAVDVSEGDSVRKGQTIMRILSMKMENEIRSDAACRVRKVLVKARQAVSKDDVLIELDKNE